MRVAGGQLYAGEASLLEFPQQLSPAFSGLPESDLESKNLSVAVFTDSDDNGCHSRPHRLPATNL